MNLPFTTEQFIDVFVRYNQAIWPMQIVAYVLGFLAVYFCFRKKAVSDRLNALVLAAFWFWMGIVYHWMYFSPVNKAAFMFGGLFVLQGALLFFSGVMRRSLSFGFKPGFYSASGLIFILYAMIIYPAIGSFLGHGYPRCPGFGVAPCPTTIFTFGLLLLTDKPLPKYLLIIPFIWSLIGFSAALALGIREDIGLLIAGILGSAFLVCRDRRKAS